MKPRTFVEKVLGAPEGAVVFRKPDLILTHDNTSSIFQTFRKMGGDRVLDPEQMVIVLDHNAPPADARRRGSRTHLGCARPVILR